MPRLNFAHLHLLLTHLAPVVSLGGALSAAAALVVRRRRVEGIQQNAIAPHEHAAKVALIVSIASALVAG